MSISCIFDPVKAARPMRVAAFMSGTGTNVKKILEHEKFLKTRDGKSPFEVIFIFSDRSDGTCAGERIAFEYGLPYFSYDIRMFYKACNLPRSIMTREGMEARKNFDSVAGKLVSVFQIDIIALGGYMSYTTLSNCVNVHPADLSIVNSDGKRCYVGDNAVKDAILAGETHLCSSTLFTDDGIDSGPLLMISAPIAVNLPVPLNELRQNQLMLDQTVLAHQAKLKEAGDWVIFPYTIEMISMGRFALDESGQVYVDGIYQKSGFKL